MKFAQILSDHNISYITEGSHHCREGWLQVDCPFCERGSKKWHMGYSLEGNYVNCYRCGSHTLLSTLMEMTGLDYGECKKLLDDISVVITKEEKPRGHLILPDRLSEYLYGPHRMYLHDRGCNVRLLEKLWKIQCIGIASRLAWRIFIPIIYKGETVSWSTRSISKNACSRYINAKADQEAMPIKSLLYGEDFIRDTAIIVEGFFSAWRIGPGAVATMGAVVTQIQLDKLIKYPVRVVCFDNDETGQTRARKLCDDLGSFPGETYNVVLDAPDPAEANEKDIKKLRRTFLK